MGACGSKEADNNEFHDANASAPRRPVKSSRKEGEERIMGDVGSLGPLEGKQSQNQPLPQQQQPQAQAAAPPAASPQPTPTPTAAQSHNPKGLHITVKEEPSVSHAPSAAVLASPYNALSPSAVAFHDQTPKPQPSVRSDNGKLNASSVDLEGVKIAMTPDAAASASASASPTPLASPIAGVKLPGDDKSERIFDVPSLDTNTLMSFACERLQVCFSTAAQLNTPALQARRQEPETVALESLRKLRFRSDGIQEVARKDLVPAMTEVLRALTMENTKVHLLEVCGIPADQTIMRALSVVIRANKALGVLHLHLSREGHTTLKGQAKVSQELCQSLQFNKRLNTLDLSGTYLGAAEGAILADLINYNTSLLHLNLSKTGLGAAGGHMAAMIQVNTSLINIDLSNNDFGDGGGRGIAHALAANANVTKLDLGENNLTVSTVTDIAKFLTANRTLRDLSLRDNDLGVPGGNALSALLKSNRTLVALNLNGCNLGIIGAKWLAKGLESNAHLTSLGLAYNDIQFDGCKAVCTAIRGNTTLAHLDLTGNSIGAKGSKEIKHLLQVNKCLQTLQLAHNNFKPKHEERIGDMLDQSCAIRNHIKFSPRLILFPVDFGRTVDLKTHLVLTNTGSANSKMKNTTAYPLTFQIASNVPAHHIIFPSMGFIQPGASVAIRIRLRGRFAKEYCRHQLTLRTMPVEPEATKSSAAGLWNERTGIAAKEASTYILRCDWSLSGNEGGVEWTAQNQETIDAHVSQGDQRARAFGSTSGPSLLLQVPSASSVAAEELKAGREKLLNDIHALRALLQEKSAKESQIEIELAEAQKRETKLQSELARARLKASAKKSKGNGAFDVSDLFFDDLEDDDDLLMLGLGRGGSHRSHRRRQRRRDEDLLDLLGESSGSGSGDDLFDDDDDRGGRRGGRGGKGGSGGGGSGGGGGGDGDGDGDGDGGDGTGTGGGSGKSGKDKPAKPPSFAPTRKPLDAKKKPNHFGGDGGDSESSSSSSEDEKEEEKKEFKPDENVVTGGAAPPAPPMAPPILGGGDVPFAPPMDGSIPMAPGMGPAALPSKKAIKPAVEMRKLHWQVVGAGDVSGTLWKDLDDGDVLGDSDLREFEAVFGAAAPSASSGGGGGGSAKAGSGKPGAKKKNPEDEDKIIFVDPKRSFNLDITLSRFRITSEQIRDCILACDDSVLTEEKLDALLKFAPLPDETKMLKKFTGDPAKLGKSEQYLRIVSAIPRLTERLELLLFKMQYPDLVTSIETALNYVEQARSQIKDSQNLKEVLKIVLAFGNYMNGGTRNGQAFGFQLDTLTKLRSAKSTDNSSNLLNFLVQHIQKKNPSISAFVTDLNAVKTACRVESSHVSKQVQRVNKHLTQLKKELRKAEELAQAGTGPAGDRFLAAFQEFYAGAHEKAKGLEKRQVQIEKECNELAAFFGAKHITKWEDLFVIFDDFLADYQSSERFLEAVRIREEAKLRREQATAAMSKGRSQSQSAPNGMSLQEQMDRRRSALGGSVGSSAAAATSGTPATVQEDHGIDLGDDSDWESD